MASEEVPGGGSPISRMIAEFSECTSSSSSSETDLNSEDNLGRSLSLFLEECCESEGLSDPDSTLSENDIIREILSENDVLHRGSKDRHQKLVSHDEHYEEFGGSEVCDSLGEVLPIGSLGLSQELDLVGARNADANVNASKEAAQGQQLLHQSSAGSSLNKARSGPLQSGQEQQSKNSFIAETQEAVASNDELDEATRGKELLRQSTTKSSNRTPKSAGLQGGDRKSQKYWALASPQDGASIEDIVFLKDALSIIDRASLKKTMSTRLTRIREKLRTSISDMGEQPDAIDDVASSEASKTRYIRGEMLSRKSSTKISLKKARSKILQSGKVESSRNLFGGPEAADTAEQVDASGDAASSEAGNGLHILGDMPLRKSGTKSSLKKARSKMLLSGKIKTQRPLVGGPEATESHDILSPDFQKPLAAESEVAEAPDDVPNDAVQANQSLRQSAPVFRLSSGYEEVGDGLYVAPRRKKSARLQDGKKGSQIFFQDAPLRKMSVKLQSSKNASQKSLQGAPLRERSVRLQSEKNASQKSFAAAETPDFIFGIDRKSFILGFLAGVTLTIAAHRRMA